MEPIAVTEKNNGESASKLESDISVHILSVSAALVGVCLTVIGLVKIHGRLVSLGTITDEMLACNAILFLLSCFISYLSLTARNKKRKHRLERIANWIFLTALLLMTFACIVFVRAFA